MRLYEILSLNFLMSLYNPRSNIFETNIVFLHILFGLYILSGFKEVFGDQIIIRTLEM